MSTQDPDVQFGTTGERLKALTLNADARERIASVATRYWELATFAFIVASAAILRFYDLGSRAMHHDESLHGFYGYGFNKGLDQFFTFGTANTDTYKHVPFMHGPWQFIGSGFLQWIFGDGEYQARLLAAIMGTGMVFLPFLFRKQLGTIGAIAASAFIAFSPTLTYYSRFTREDIYTGFWTLGLVIFMMRYLATKEDKFLYLSAGFMAGFFCTKETAFMQVGAFLGFLDVMLAYHLAEKIADKRKMSDVGYWALVVVLSPFAWLIAAAWPFIESWRAQYGLDELPAEGNLLIVLGTLAGPQYAGAIQMLLGTEWRNRPGETSDYHVHPDEAAVAYTTILMLIFAASFVGLMWRPKTWLIASAAFWVPFILLYTTFFSNLPGFWSGMWGSLDYWMSQQDVARGNQPDHYYFITIPVYEFLTLALSFAAMFYYGVRGSMTRAAIVGGLAIVVIVLLLMPAGPHLMKVSTVHVWAPFLLTLLVVMTLPMDTLNRFLIFWLVVTALGLTVASEKMPWLNVHIALALAVLAGKFVGDVLSGSDLKDDLPRLERLAPFAYAAAAAALSVLVFVLVGPFAPASFGAWALAVIAAVAVWWAFNGYSRRTAMQVALVGAIAAFMVFTLRAGVLASWGHPDNPYVGQPGDVATRDYGEVPTELLVYTQTSGDIPVLFKKLEKYAKETGKGYNQPVVVDSSDGFTWPWAWYLRRYKSVNYTNVGSGFQPAPGAVMFIANSNSANVKVGDLYEPAIAYHHRRWFPEAYRDVDGHYSTHDSFRDVVDIDRLRTWLDFWVRRTLPANEPGTVDGLAFFPKGAGVIPSEPAAPTVRSEGSQIIIGGEGPSNGQLNAPSDVAIDSAGNIYVADTNNGRINKYDAQGVYQSVAGGFTSPDLTLNQPWSVTVSQDGTVFITDTWNHKIVKLDKDLKKVKEWGSGGQTEAGGDPMRLFGPREITITPDGNLLVTDTGNNRIIEYTQEGEFVRQFGSKGSGALQFNEPVGIAVNDAGDMYIADYWNKRIVVLDKDLGAKRTIDVPSWGSQATSDRAYLALLDDGRLLATDPASGQIITFGADGARLGAYDVPKEGRITFARPIGIATDGISVVVAESGGSVVRKMPLAEVAK